MLTGSDPIIANGAWTIRRAVPRLGLPPSARPRCTVRSHPIPCSPACLGGGRRCPAASTPPVSISNSALPSRRKPSRNDRPTLHWAPISHGGKRLRPRPSPYDHGRTDVRQAQPPPISGRAWSHPRDCCTVPTGYTWRTVMERSWCCTWHASDLPYVVPHAHLIV